MRSRGTRMVMASAFLLGLALASPLLFAWSRWRRRDPAAAPRWRVPG